MLQLKKIALAAAIVVGLTAGAPKSALALSAGDIIGPVIQGVVTFFAGPFSAMLQVMMSQIIGQATATISGEISKSAIANKAVQEGLESYRQTETLRKDALTLSAKYEMPANTCADMAAQDAMGKASQRNQAAIIRGQNEVRAALVGNTNTLRVIDDAHKKTNEKYCTKEDAARGICSFRESNELAGADQDALFLFQARGGSRTYSPAPGASGNSAQYEAAGDYIRRVAVGIPPEQLRTENMDKTPQGRAYVELVRRYQSLISMSSYSLNQIRESGNPIKGLGNTTQLAKVEGFAPEEDMSMNEAVRRFVATQFSPAVIRDLSTATQPEKILRAMATQNSFGLWMDFQALEQNARVEGLLASQLVLAAEQGLRPQIDAQRAVATRVK